MSINVDALLTTSPVMPVLVIERVEDAVPLAEALKAGGLKVLEVTLRTDSAIEVIKEIADKVDDVIVGAGTVTTPTSTLRKASRPIRGSSSRSR